MAEIRLEHLTKHFGDVKAVEDLSLVAEHGSFIALLGPSGCGKTTTMNMISGLERPTAGEIYFDDTAIKDLEPGQRNVGFVFQNYAIFTHMSVYENLAFGLRVKKPRPPGDEPEVMPKPEAPVGYGGPVPPGGWQHEQPSKSDAWGGRPLAGWWSRVGAAVIDWLFKGRGR